MEAMVAAMEVDMGMAKGLPSLDMEDMAAVMEATVRFTAIK
jgi:hypothetical protein